MSFNSSEYSYCDMKVSVLAKELGGLRGLTWEEEVEKEEVYGQGGEPKSIQPGRTKRSGNLMLLKSDYDELNKAAIAAGYANILKVPTKFITITCVFQREGEVSLQTNGLIGVAFTKTEDGMKEGDKFKEITLPFKFLKLKTS